MPANLTPEYLAAERKFRQARTDEEKLQCLQEMLALIPKHKGTEKMQADIKRKISKFKGRVDQARRRSKKGFSYKIDKEGAGQVTLIGPPSAGKSSLLARLTRATPEVADYPFTTHAAIPGMMSYEDVRIQLIDLPPVCEEHTEPWVIELARAADAVLLIIDLSNEALLEQLDYILRRFEKTKLLLVGMDDNSGDLAGQTGGPFIHRRTIIVGNKIDVTGAEERLEIVKEFYAHRFPIIAISARLGTGLEALNTMIFQALKVIRAYSKEPGNKPDLSVPFTLPRGSTVLDLAQAIHKDFAKNFKYARIWGSTRFEGQVVNRDFPLSDGDIVEVHLKTKVGQEA